MSSMSPMDALGTIQAQLNETPLTRNDRIVSDNAVQVIAQCLAQGQQMEHKLAAMEKEIKALQKASQPDTSDPDK